ncbi:putative ABC transport system permease protein [Microlunatus parietis]|uniref:Putative ABC transport system permease protein n=2 Tax=Microlunatus parietis TaxID=682979 RepID=A0A7Y9LCU5_9ACTN|nr:putative ABC transport system permease protein [Microlunatus parietis]
MIRPGDLLDEAILGIGSRPARLLLTMIGTVIGIGALVATIGLGQTAGGQIAEKFDAAAATRVVVRPADSGFGMADGSAPQLAADVAERIARLAGVVAAGTISEVDIGDQTVSGVLLNDPAGSEQIDLDVYATSADLLRAAGGSISVGRSFDAGHDRRADPVVVLGSRAAERLGITRVDQRPVIFIGDHPYSVIGIVGDAGSRPELLDSVIIPYQVAVDRYGLDAPEQVEVKTVLGAAQQVAGQAAIAASPNDPTQVRVTAPPPPGSLGSDVQADLNTLLLAFGAVALVVGGIGIANVTLLSVMERSGEIGLRRALGARRRHIAAQFLAESGLLGGVGGLIGTAFSILVILVVSLAQQWTPVLHPALPVLAPILGAVIGLAAGAYPALKAAAIEPMAALRQAE